MSVLRTFFKSPERFCGLFLKVLYTRGNPTRPAPRPKPAPWRAVTPMVGVNVSRRANVAKAATPIVRISPKWGFLGLRTMTATRATTRPSIRYLKSDAKRSGREKFMALLYFMPRKLIGYFKITHNYSSY